MTKYVLWLGPVVDETTMLACSPGVSPAANRWQFGLLNALQKIGSRVVAMGHVPEPLWPRGRFRKSAEKDRLATGLSGKLLSYWNIPVLRSSSLTISYMSSLRELCEKEGCPAVVISYNDYAWNVAAGRYAQERLGIPWVCVVADGPGLGKDFIKHEERINSAMGRIFLSWGRYISCKRKPKLHLDGGITRPNFNLNNHLSPHVVSKPVVLFTGAMNRWTGISLLVKGFREVKNKEIELWLCGPGVNTDVKRALETDPRIKFFGLIDEKRLRDVSTQAAVFINPRPSSIIDNRSNFPSKVLEYLSYGKPVISTWTEGLSPDYKDVLVVLDDENPLDLAKKIEEVIGWDETQLRANAGKIFSFINLKKLWPLQAQNLIRWLNTEGFISSV